MNIEENAKNYIPNEENIINDNIENSMNVKKENSILGFLKSETGEGTIQSYSNHPLNKENNNSISQMLRGLTGMLGSLNYAILDIILGGLGFVKDKKDLSNNDLNNSENEIPNNGHPNVVNGQRYD